MAFEKRDNSGAMFANARKEKDSHPDRTGYAMIDGREYWVNGWVKQDRNGKPYLSLAFKPKAQAQAKQSASAEYEDERHADARQAAAIERGIQSPGGNAPRRTAPAGKSRDMDDEIPFAPEWR